MNKILRGSLLLCTLLLSQYTFAATLNISIKGNNVTIKSAFEAIEKQTKMTIAYDESILDVSKHISSIIQDKTLDAALSIILKETGCSYVINDNHIVISGKSSVNQDDASRITGVVTDEKGEVIIGANIKIKGSSSVAVTDVNGNFAVKAASKDILQVSYVGYLTQDVVVGNKKTLTIKLAEDSRKLDEVVVIGYGTMKKRDLTGAVSSVKMNDTPVGTFSTISHALAGKAAGLQVNTVSAQPGGGTSFRIRGAASINAGNDPLIIIDGFPVSDPGNLGSGTRYSDGAKDNILASINPNDIESIEVLKDASSTAIFGARAGNGVIIVTTKRGKTGQAKVQYQGNASVQQIAKGYEMLGATDFMLQTNHYKKEVWMIENQVYPYGDNKESDIPSSYEPKYTADQIAKPAHDTNWFDEVTRMGFQTQHNLSITGGTENTQYMVSGNYFKQDGIVKNNAMERFSARVNLDQRLSKYIKTGININISRNKYDNVPLGDGGNEDSGILVAAARFNPLIPVKDTNGEYPLNEEAAYLPNPVSLLEITDKTNKERLLGTVYFEAEPIRNLKLKANFGIDRNYQKRKTYLPTTTLYGKKMGGQAFVNQTDRSDYLTELTLNYSKEINAHNFSVLGGYSYQIFDKEALGAGNNNFLIDGFLYNNLNAGAAPKPTVYSSASKDKLASFFARANYSFMDRYLLTTTFRTDGSSNFAKGNQWGFFPSVALGWRFTEEEFMQSLKNVISNGKLRLSYGETGNANVGNKAISYYQVGNNNIFGDTEAKGVYLSQLGNPNLKWETTREWNIGLDLGLLDNKINLTAEYFNREVSDLLNNRVLLSYNEVSNITANVGSTQSKGFELTVNTHNVSTRQFTWTSDLTVSLYRDKWKKRDPNWKPSAYSIYNAPIRGSYGYKSDGLIKPGETVSYMPGSFPGQIKIKDLDGFKLDSNGKIMVDNTGKPLKTGVPDGKLDDADKVFYGSSDPGYLLGFNNTLKYGNFDLNFYLYGQFNKLTFGDYHNNFMSLDDLRRGINNPVSALDVWSHDNLNGSQPGLTQVLSMYGEGDYFLQKTWFIRMRNITLGYNIPLSKTNKLLSNVRVYFDVNNLFTITPYKGLDPETDVDTFSYPNIRTYSFGLDITF